MPRRCLPRFGSTNVVLTFCYFGRRAVNILLHCAAPWRGHIRVLYRIYSIQNRSGKSLGLENNKIREEEHLVRVGEGKFRRHKLPLPKLSLGGKVWTRAVNYHTEIEVTAPKTTGGIPMLCRRHCPDKRPSRLLLPFISRLNGKEAITLGAVMKKFPLLSSPFCLKSFASS